MNRSPVVTGLGIVAAPGLGVNAVWDSIAANRIGLRPLSLFKSPRYGQLLAGEIPEDFLHAEPRGRGSRSDRLAMIAAQQAVADAGLTANDLGDQAGVLLGSSVGGSYDSEFFLAALLDRGVVRARPTRFHECVSSVESVAERIGCYGPSFAIATACSSGALAIATAAEFIQTGEADVMLAGGADSLSRMTWGGFHSLLLVDGAGCRPFDAERAGMSLGEGGAVLILESEDHARARGAKIHARLSGWAASCDAYHATAPQPEGRGAADAMRAALERGGLKSDAIDYINAHGTGTKDNDVAEGRGMRSVFGDQLPPFSSTKRFFGHALAASGALEAVVCVEALRRQQTPPNPGFNTVDPAIGLSPVTALRPGRLRHVMSNSFGFGGNNAVLIFSASEETTCPRTAEQRPASVTGIGIVAPEVLAPVHIGRPMPEGDVMARSCGIPSDVSKLTPNQRRRLSRLLQLTLIAARRGPAREAGARHAVAVGTGLGCLEDAEVFLTNLIALQEREPMPSRFPNSVHNAPAAQLAMDQDARGLNSAPTAGEISFECALWQATRQLATGEADRALAGAVDEHSKFPLGIGKRWGLWNDQTVPGEGAVIVTLASGAGSIPTLARVRTVRLGRYRRPFDPEREAAWIANAIDLSRVDVLLTGAKPAGSSELDEHYRQVAAAVAKIAGRRLEIRTFKQDCGEFHAASAFGFAAALDCLREGFRGVALYTLARRGGKAVCLIEA